MTATFFDTVGYVRLGYMGDRPEPVSVAISLIRDVLTYTLSYELQIDNRDRYTSSFESFVQPVDGPEDTIRCEALLNPRPSPYQLRKCAICLPAGSSTVNVVFLARHVCGPFLTAVCFMYARHTLCPDPVCFMWKWLLTHVALSMASRTQFTQYTG